MANGDGGVNIPVTSSADLSGFDAAAKASLDLGARLRALEGEEQKAGTPVSPVVKPIVGAEEVERRFKELTGDAEEFLNALKLGVSINIGEKIIESLAEVSSKIKEAISEGVDYNAEIESSLIGFASTLQSVQPEIYKTRDAAKSAASDIFGSVKDYAIKNGLNVKTTFEALSANYNAFVESGVTDTEKQIQFVSTILAAEASKGIDGQRALKDSIDLLQGRFNNLVFAKEIGVTADEFKRAAENGQQVDYILSHLTGYSAGIAEQANSFKGLSTSVAELEKQLEGTTFAPVFVEISTALRELKTELQDPAVADGLRAVGFEVAEVVHTGAGLLEFAVKNAGALAGLTQVVVIAGAAFSAVKVANLVAGLAQLAIGGPAAAAGVAEAGTAAVVAGEEMEGAAVASGGLGAGFVALAANPATLLIVALAAIGAGLVKMSADLDVATAKSNALGAGFDKARGTNPDLIDDARTQAGFDKRTKELQAQIDKEKKIIAEGTDTFDPGGDPTGGDTTITILSDSAKAAQEQVFELENRLKELDALRRGQLDTTNIEVATHAEAAKKAISDVDAEATASGIDADKITKARQQIVDTIGEQKDAQADLAKINAYLASDEGKRLASTKEGEAAINDLKRQQKQDVDLITAAEQKLADLRESAFPKETAEIAALNAQLKAMASDGTEATADARSALQNQIRDLTNTTKGIKPQESLDELERRSDAAAGEPAQPDTDFLRQGTQTNGALPGAVDPNGTGAISDFGRRPDLSQPTEHDDIPPTDDNTAADDTSATAQKVGEANDKLDAATGTLRDDAGTLATNTAAVSTALADVSSKTTDYHTANAEGLQNLSDAHTANTDALSKVVAGLIQTAQTQAGTIAQLQLQVDNIGSDDA